MQKTVSMIDLNPLGACISVKQQSDKKLSESENKQLNHEAATKINEGQCHRPQGEFQFSP